MSESEFEVSYGTTADFDYCPVCGSFGDHYNYDEGCYECDEYDRVSESELADIISQYQEDDDHTIRME